MASTPPRETEPPVAAPGETAPGEPQAPAQPGASACPRCGASTEPLQEYCLECGMRLAGPDGVVSTLAGAWTRRFAWYPGDWIWPTLLALLIAAVAATVLIILRSEEPSASPQTIVATMEQPPTTPTRRLAPPPEPPANTPVRPPPRDRTERPRPNARQLATWQAGRDGYTVVLRSIPTSAGRGLAAGEARRARRAGVRSVGLLESSRYASLHPGYYVVFSGIYGSLEEATNALPRVRARGYPLAYPRQIAS